MRIRSFRHALWLAPLTAAVVGGVVADRWLNAAAPSAAALAAGRPAAALPVSRVVLFNSGVGYFSREGKVSGNARVDLTFLERDVNDLLKSMTLQDLDGGRVAAVAYESREPVDRTLASFAINLAGNPTVAQILTQARGERVEVALKSVPGAEPDRLTGTVVGMETRTLPHKGDERVETQMLNLLTADGLRSIDLSEVLRVRFVNPALEAEFRRALEVVASGHDAQKKAVSIEFVGDGERRVRVGYVADAPVWKTSYRLALDENGKPQLQGWAIVENTTDEDWTGVKMALVSGRPISFRMDLYNPLYVPRPTVEPELFASLRPRAYDGGFGVDGKEDFTLRGMNSAEAETKPSDTPANAPLGGSKNQGQVTDGRMQDKQSEDLSRYAGAVGKALAERMDLAAVQSAASASQLGDSFQYVIDHPVSLARQKSAMLPVVSAAVAADRLSIYNQAVQGKHPLLGVRFTNTTGATLSQGPVTVFDGSTYAGDARIMDVQPGEQRLLSFAIDLGMEVNPEAGPGSSRVTAVRAHKGIVTVMNKQVEEKKYKVVNRAEADRTLVIEHPNRTGQQFALVDTPKPIEETAEVLRFQLPVPAGKTETFTVKEEKEYGTTYALTNSGNDTIAFLLKVQEVGPELKAKLQEAVTKKGQWDDHRRELQQVQADLTRLSSDQDRIRKNLRETPPQAEVYKTYLAKLSAQEKEIDTLTEKQKDLMAAEFAGKKAYEDYLVTISD